jgi:phosphopantothenoylcysteine decarboxylase/phosphopantothenate--cysteine ligase
MLIGNLAQHVMDADHTTVSIFDEAGEHRLPKSSKQDVARQLIEAIAQRMPQVAPCKA